MTDTIAQSLPYRTGVGAVLFNKDGKVFAGHRGDIATNTWQFPQGGVDSGEEPEDAVLRELEEEIGTRKAIILARASRWFRYDLPADLIGKAWKGRYRGQQQQWFALRFTGEDADIDLDATDHPEFDDWQWMDLESMPSLVVPFKQPLYIELVSEFRHFVANLAKLREGCAVSHVD